MKTHPKNGRSPSKTHPKHGRSPSGFTLIELMVSMTLLSLVSYLVYQAFEGVVMSTESTQIAAAELRLRQFLSRSLTVNLSQAYGDWRPGAAMRNPLEEEDLEAGAMALEALEDEMLGVRYFLEGVNEDGLYGPADSLSFASTAPLLGNRSLPGFLKQVTYEVVRREPDLAKLKFEDALEDGAQYHTLDVTESPIMIEPEDADGGPGMTDFDATLFEDTAEDIGQTSPGWSVPIRSLNFDYFDGEDWVEEWDSISMGRLPWSVRIRANFARTKEGLDADRDAGLDPLEDPDFDLTVILPAGLGTLQEPPAYVPSDERMAGGAGGPRTPSRSGSTLRGGATGPAASRGGVRDPANRRPRPGRGGRW